MGEQARQENVRDLLVRVVDGLSPERQEQVLEFALFVRARHEERRAGAVQRIEELWGDFWPEGESVDEFVDTVRRWRREDVKLHTM